MADRSVVRLYRCILRLHCQQLPHGAMRELGDRVVREEWSAMRSAERRGKATQQQWSEFVGAWTRYADTLGATVGGAPEAEESAAELAARLTPEQQTQLSRLREQAFALRDAPAERDG